MPSMGAAGEGVRVTWDTTFLFLSHTPQGSKNGKKEDGKGVALLSRWGRLWCRVFPLVAFSLCGPATGGGLRGVILALRRGKEPLVQLSAGSGLPSMPLVQAVCLVL